MPGHFLHAQPVEVAPVLPVFTCHSDQPLGPSPSTSRQEPQRGQRAVNSALHQPLPDADRWHCAAQHGQFRHQRRVQLPSAGSHPAAAHVTGRSGESGQQPGTFQTRPHLHILRKNLLQKVRPQDSHQVSGLYFQKFNEINLISI